MNTTTRDLAFTCALLALCASIASPVWAKDPPPTDQLVEDANQAMLASQAPQQQDLRQDQPGAHGNPRNIENRQQEARRVINNNFPSEQLRIIPRDELRQACLAECARLGYPAAECSKGC